MTFEPKRAPTHRVVLQRFGDNGVLVKPQIDAQFNPTSLQYTITNAPPQGSSKQNSRQVGESTGKLTMDLVFDTTDDGSDVRNRTQEIALLMKPGTGKLTPIVQVTWGVFKFKGALDQYRENIDFFSPDGVPLRATLSLGFTTVAVNNQTPSDVFRFGSTPPKPKPEDDPDITIRDPALRAFEVPAPVGPLDRGTAQANDVEDPRNGTDVDDTLIVPTSPNLSGPVAFATGGAGFGAGAGVGAGVGFGAGAAFGASAGASAGVSMGFGGGASAGLGLGVTAGAGAGFSAGAGAGFSAGASGSASDSYSYASTSWRAGSLASMGVSASAGAFARLRPPAPPPPATLDVTQLFLSPGSLRVTVDSPTAFGPGGRVVRTGSSSLDSGVGASVSLREVIEFEE